MSAAQFKAMSEKETLSTFYEHRLSHVRHRHGSILEEPSDVSDPVGTGLTDPDPDPDTTVTGLQGQLQAMRECKGDEDAEEAKEGEEGNEVEAEMCEMEAGASSGEEVEKNNREDEDEEEEHGEEEEEEEEEEDDDEDEEDCYIPGRLIPESRDGARYSGSFGRSRDAQKKLNQERILLISRNPVAFQEDFASQADARLR